MASCRPPRERLAGCDAAVLRPGRKAPYRTRVAGRARVRRRGPRRSARSRARSEPRTGASRSGRPSGWVDGLRSSGLAGLIGPPSVALQEGKNRLQPLGHPPPRSFRSPRARLSALAAFAVKQPRRAATPAACGARSDHALAASRPAVIRRQRPGVASSRRPARAAPATSGAHDGGSGAMARSAFRVRAAPRGGRERARPPEVRPCRGRLALGFSSLMLPAVPGDRLACEPLDHLCRRETGTRPAEDRSHLSCHHSPVRSVGGETGPERPLICPGSPLAYALAAAPAIGRCS